MEMINVEDARKLAVAVAKTVKNRDMPEYAGAMKIWKEIIDFIDGPCPDDLWPFKSNASAIEDIKWNAEQGGAENEPLIRECENNIMKAMKNLLEQS